MHTSVDSSIVVPMEFDLFVPSLRHFMDRHENDARLTINLPDDALCEASTLAVSLQARPGSFGGEVVVEWTFAGSRLPVVFRGMLLAYDAGSGATRLELTGTCERSESRRRCEACARTFGGAMAREILRSLRSMIQIYG